MDPVPAPVNGRELKKLLEKHIMQNLYHWCAEDIMKKIEYTRKLHSILFAQDMIADDARILVKKIENHQPEEIHNLLQKFGTDLQEWLKSISRLKTEMEENFKGVITDSHDRWIGFALEWARFLDLKRLHEEELLKFLKACIFLQNNLSLDNLKIIANMK